MKNKNAINIILISLIIVACNINTVNANLNGVTADDWEEVYMSIDENIRYDDRIRFQRTSGYKGYELYGQTIFSHKSTSSTIMEDKYNRSNKHLFSESKTWGVAQNYISYAGNMNTILFYKYHNKHNESYARYYIKGFRLTPHNILTRSASTIDIPIDINIQHGYGNFTEGTFIDDNNKVDVFKIAYVSDEGYKLAAINWYSSGTSVYTIDLNTNLGEITFIDELGTFDDKVYYQVEIKNSDTYICRADRGSGELETVVDTPSDVNEDIITSDGGFFVVNDVMYVAYDDYNRNSVWSCNINQGIWEREYILPNVYSDDPKVIFNIVEGEDHYRNTYNLLYVSYAEKEYVLDISPKMNITGTVKDQWNNTIQGAVVEFNGVTTTTNSNGQYSLSVKEDTSDLTISKAGYTTVSTPKTITEDTNIGTTTLNKNNFDVTGKIVDTTGKGISGVTVKVNNNNSYSGTTNASGVYSISNIPTSVGTVSTIVAEHSSYNNLTTTVNKSNAEIVNINNITLKKNYSITGTVLNQWGNKVNGVKFSYNGKTANTNSSGYFTLSQEEFSSNKTYSLTKDGYTTKSGSIALNSNKNLGNITMTKNNFDVTGKIVDTEGKAISNATVIINDNYNGVTNSSGEYNITVPSSVSKVTKMKVSHNNFETRTVTMDRESKEELSLNNIELYANIIIETNVEDIMKYSNNVDGYEYILTDEKGNEVKKGSSTEKENIISSLELGRYNLELNLPGADTVIKVIDLVKNTVINVDFKINNSTPIYEIDPGSPIVAPRRTLTVNSNVTNYSIELTHQGNGHVIDMKDISNSSTVIPILYSGIYDVKGIKENYNTYNGTIDLTYSNDLELNLYVTQKPPIMEWDDEDKVETPKRILTLLTNVGEYDIALKHKEMDYVIEENNVVSNKLEIPILYSGFYDITLSKEGYDTITETLDLTYSNEYSFDLYVTTDNPIYEIDPDNPIVAPRRTLTVNTNVSDYNIKLVNKESGYSIEEHINDTVTEIPILYSGVYDMTIEKENYYKHEEIVDLTHSEEITVDLYVVVDKPIMEWDDEDKVETPKRILTLLTNVDDYDIALKHKEMDYVIEENNVVSNKLEIPILYSGFYDMTLSKEGYDTITETLDLTYSNEYSFDLYVTTDNPIHEIDPDNPIEAPRRTLTVNTNVSDYNIKLINKESGYVIEEYINDTVTEIPILYSGIYSVKITKEDYHDYVGDIDLKYSNNLDVHMLAKLQQPIQKPEEDIVAPKRILKVYSNKTDYEILLEHRELDYNIYLENIEESEIEIPILYAGEYNIKVDKKGHHKKIDTIDLTYSNEYTVNLSRIEDEDESTPTIEVPEEEVEIEEEIEEEVEIEEDDTITIDDIIEGIEDGSLTEKDIIDLIDQGLIDGEILDLLEELGLISREEYLNYIGYIMSSVYKFLYYKTEVDSTLITIEFEDETKEYNGDVESYINKETYSTMIPLRSLIESADVNPVIEWDNESKTCEIIFEEKKLNVRFKLNSNIFYINNRPVHMINHKNQRLAVEDSNNRLLVPFRYIGEFMHFDVYYDNRLNKAVVDNI